MAAVAGAVVLVAMLFVGAVMLFGMFGGETTEDITVPADKILNNLKREIGNQRHAIVLMHDASAKTTTADALPQIIEYLQQRGYELLPLAEDTPPVRHRVNN